MIDTLGGKAFWEIAQQALDSIDEQGFDIVPRGPLDEPIEMTPRDCIFFAIQEAFNKQHEMDEVEARAARMRDPKRLP